eukprot:4946534-Pleurochrysis_carterae.AAC.1
MIDTFREGEAKFPLFEPDNLSAVEFLKAVLDSVVGTRSSISQTVGITITYAVVLHRYKLLKAAVRCTCGHSARCCFAHRNVRMINCGRVATLLGTCSQPFVQRCKA